MSEGEEKRGKGGGRPMSAEDMRASLTQDQIDKLVAGDSIKE
jgi:hypothetical protein